MTRELLEYRRKKNDMVSMPMSQSSSYTELQLRKTMVKYQATTGMSIQLKSANTQLASRNKSSETKAHDLERKMQLITLKYNSSENENRHLKERLVDMELRHVK